MARYSTWIMENRELDPDTFDRFTQSLPEVLAQGRKVINNIEVRRY